MQVARKLLTLCMVGDDEKVLLGMKKRGFGAGRWNGFGGKVDTNESIKEAALRELVEEIGIEAMEMSKVGILEFSFVSDPVTLEVHIFRVTKFSGEPTESEEMRPQWFSYEKVPFSQMWVDDEFWFPYLRAGKLFKGKFLFDTPATADYAGKILEMELGETNNLE